MRRDMDLIRFLLLEIEKKDDGSGGQIEISATEASHEKVTEHLFMMEDAGFIDARDASSMGGKDIIVRRMTWHGHDFLESVRDDEIWNLTKEGATAAGGFTVDLLKALAKGFLKQKIKDQTGIEL